MNKSRIGNDTHLFSWKRDSVTTTNNQFHSTTMISVTNIICLLKIDLQKGSN